MAGVWGRPLKVGKTGYFIVAEDLAWLGDDVITSASATTGPGVVVVDTVPEPSRVVILLQGVDPGLHDVEVNYQTGAGLSDCFKAKVKVVNC